ncbi:MAG: hypothetical protein ACRDO2_11670, partial [Nocardioidaceae bacterium]
MPRSLVAVVVLALTFGIAPLASSASSEGAPSASRTWDGPTVAVPARSIEVSGTGVGMYPAFDPDVRRYAVTTTGATQGVVTVRASTSDPGGRIRINGRPDADGAASLRGLEDGDEISVFITDSAGTRAYALLYLPAGFPELEVVTQQPGIMPGRVGLTLSQWVQGTTPPNFEVAIDPNGVPVFVRSTMAASSLDLKRQPNGHYSVSRPTDTPGRWGEKLVELDAQFREIATYETLDLVNT